MAIINDIDQLFVLEELASIANLSYKTWERSLVILPNGIGDISPRLESHKARMLRDALRDVLGPSRYALMQRGLLK